MDERLTAEQEADVLSFDPWGERDATYRVLAEKFGATRKTHCCAICFEAIPVGARVWMRREVDDGRAETFYFCQTCCWCIAHRYDEIDENQDGFDRMYERWEVGRTNAESQRAAAEPTGRETRGDEDRWRERESSTE